MRKKILEMLRDTGKNFISGNEIADKLNISRTAVWKHINQLRDSGYKISSRENRGYKLETVPDLLMPLIVQSELKTKFIARGSLMVYKDSLDSTNEFAKKLAFQGAEEGTVVCAEEQTEGKGRLDRKFFSPKSKGILFSIILRPKCTPKDAPKFTLLAAVAVAKTMERFNLRPEIKWPNDIMHDGRKIVGILTEMSAAIESVKYIVVGIGINVNVTREEFPEEIRNIATSLAEINGEFLSRVKFFCALLEEFENLYEIANAEGFEKIFELWRKFNITLGKSVNVISIDSGEIFNGVAKDIDSDGALIVETDDGRRTVYAADVSIRN